MKRLDFIIIGAVLLLALAGWVLLLPRGAVTNAEAVIEKDGIEIGRYPLSVDTQVDIGGHNLVVIENKTVRMASADCPDRLCVNQGAIESGIIACLPNGVTVRVDGGEPDVDITVR